MGNSKTVTVYYAELEESIYNLNEAMNSIEESMKICYETIDTYGEQLYEDIVNPLKESRLDLIPKLLEIVDE